MRRNWLFKIDGWKPEKIVFWSVIAACCLAAWMQYIQHGWINPDSVLYFEQTKRFIAGDWQGMVSLFSWPLYAICIGTVHQLTSFTIQTSAQCLNILFFGISTYGFLSLIRELNGNSRTLFFGIALLFSAQYIVGDVLEMLMRDEGFWAFYLTGLLFFIRYIKTGQLKEALFWQASLIVATLFRLEAIVYLLFLPVIFFAFSHTYPSRIKHIVKSYLLVMVIAISLMIFLIMHQDASMAQFGRLHEIFNNHLYQTITEKLFKQSEVMGDLVLGHYLDEFATEGLLITFLMVLVTKSITATGVMPSLLAFFAIKDRNSVLPANERLALLILAVISLLVAGLIIIKMFVLSKRYLVSFVWLMLIFASFQLNKLSNQTSTKSRLILLLIMLVMSLGFVKNVMPKREGYNYQQDAVHWLNASKTSNEKVYYDDSRLRYYANDTFVAYGELWTDFVKLTETTHALPYDYIVVTIRKRDQKKQSLIDSLGQYHEVKRFYAPANKKYCAIYQRKETN